MPMVYGLRKKILQSAEVVALEVGVVYKIESENGYFRYEVGTEPPLNHAPMLDIPDDEATDGKIVAAYSIATMRDGTKSYELMRRADINKVRQMSQTGAIGRIAKYDMGDIKKGQEIPPKGPWVDWFGEMAKKTVMRRHSKTLPMSGDVLIDVEGRELERNASSAFALGSTAPDAAELLTDDTGTHYDPATGEVHDEPEQDERRDDQPAQVNDQAEPSTDTPELFNNDDGEARQKQEEEANRLIGEMSEARNVVTLKKVYDGNELEIASLPDDLASDVESSYDRNLKRFGTTRVKVAKVIAEANAEAASAK
jgi:recombination protein RecT